MGSTQSTPLEESPIEVNTEQSKTDEAPPEAENKRSDTIEDIQDVSVTEENKDVTPNDNAKSADSTSEESAPAVLTLTDTDDEGEEIDTGAENGEKLSVLDALFARLIDPCIPDYSDNDSSTGSFDSMKDGDSFSYATIPEEDEEDTDEESEAYVRQNELFGLISKHRWMEVRNCLKLMKELDEHTYNDQHEMLTRDKVEKWEMDKNGRTALAVACAEDSAPPDIIKTMVEQYPLWTRQKDVNSNLPIHHFCHSYRKSEKKVSESELHVLKLLHQACPKGLQTVNKRANTPLHVFMEHKCGSDMRQGTVAVVVRLLQMFPEAAAVENDKGCLPLHLIAKSSKTGASSKQSKRVDMGPEGIRSLVRVMHKANPVGICSRNKQGMTPLFSAVIHGGSMETLSAMLAICPGAALVDNGRGITPIAAHWNMFVDIKKKKKYIHVSDENFKEEAKRIDKNRKEMGKVKSITHLRLYGSPRLNRFWEKMELLLRAGSSGTKLAYFAPKDKDWKVVHAICSISNCPAEALRFALRLYPSQAEEADENGNLPLHIVSGLSVWEGKEAKNVHSMIKVLISTCLLGAEELNTEGRLPLHIALESGKTWATGVKTLYNASQKAVKAQDPITGLYPFMMAALPHPEKNTIEDFNEKVEDLEQKRFNTIYKLLRVAPKMVSSGIKKPKAKGKE